MRYYYPGLAKEAVSQGWRLRGYGLRLRIIIRNAVPACDVFSLKTQRDAEERLYMDRLPFEIILRVCLH